MVERGIQKSNIETKKGKRNIPHGRGEKQEAIVLGRAAEKSPQVGSKIVPGSGINPETGECAHHWILGPEVDGISSGVCIHCGTSRPHGVRPAEERWR